MPHGEGWDEENGKLAENMPWNKIVTSSQLRQDEEALV